MPLSYKHVAKGRTRPSGSVKAPADETHPMRLETMRPDPKWKAADHREEVRTVAAVGDSVTFLVWGDDGCSDCQRVLPRFGALLEAAGVSRDRVITYPVERLPEGRKRGPRVDEFGIERIPTIVVARDYEEVVRFVEDEELSVEAFIAKGLGALEPSV